MNNFKHEFKVDEVTKTISFAGVEFKRFQLLRKASESMSLMDAYDEQPVVGHKNPNARKFSDKYQITPAKFRKVFNAKMLNLWVDPIKEHANRFAYNSMGKLNPTKVACIWEVLPEIEQAKKDGIYHIVPWILAEGKNPHELKEKFGKGTWKKICSQSMTRNKFIAAGSSRFRYEGSVEDALALPSYILKRGGNSNLSWKPVTKWLVENKLINSKPLMFPKRREVEQLAHMYTDTQRMSGELGKGFSHNWGPDKMKEKHAEYVRLINLKRYSPEPYECLKGIEVKEVQHKGYVATLLDSAALVHEEGEVMHHCVGGYASSVAQGNYLVYSVTKDGKRSSTIAFRGEKIAITENFKLVGGRTDWRFNQHYGYCNAYIEDKHEAELKEVILNQLNPKVLEKAA